MPGTCNNSPPVREVGLADKWFIPLPAVEAVGLWDAAFIAFQARAYCERHIHSLL